MLKFIYLKRNPYTVFESTRSFFTNTIQPLRLQDISNEQIESNFIEVYRRLFYKYEEQKHLIPEGNLVEVKFEDFEQDAFAMTEDIYKKLNLPGFVHKPYRAVVILVLVLLIALLFPEVFLDFSFRLFKAGERKPGRGEV